MHHWPGCWLSRVPTREPDTWKSYLEKFFFFFFKENSYFLFGYLLMKIAVTSWKSQTVQTPYCICGILHFSAKFPRVVFFLAESVTFTQMLLLDCCVQLRTRCLSFFCALVQSWDDNDSRYYLSTLAAPSLSQSDICWQRTHHQFMPGRFFLYINLDWNWNSASGEQWGSCSCWLVWFWAA